jgi:hypothetical protein
LGGLQVIYVDSVTTFATTKKWNHAEGCHMVADSLQELHDFAVKLKLGPSWFFQNHYRLTLTKRRMALKNGAQEISTLDFITKAHEMMEKA